MLSTMTSTDLYKGHLDLYHGWDRVEVLNRVSTPIFPQNSSTNIVWSLAEKVGVFPFLFMSFGIKVLHQW